MPDWFYPLMLVVILAGYIFLFLQGRMLSRNQDELRQDFQKLDLLVRDSAPRRTVLVSATPPARVEPPPPIEIPPELTADLARIRELLAAQAESIESLQRAMEALPSELKLQLPAPKIEVQDLSPEEVARKFLMEEGFSRIHITGREVRGSGTRFLVRAMRGDEVRTGHLLVVDSKVTEAALRAPSALFP